MAVPVEGDGLYQEPLLPAAPLLTAVGCDTVLSRVVSNDDGGILLEFSEERSGNCSRSDGGRVG